ncbi:MAG: ATP-binding protein [Lawsonella clevelandensis]
MTVRLDTHEGLLVWGDRTLLVMALHNLIENAIRYSDGGKQVVVSRERMLVGTLRERMSSPNTNMALNHALRDEQELYVVQVTDKGVGIAPKHINRIFERFYRVDKARSRGRGGTGLGLAIVKEIALNMGGVVAVWSKPGCRVDVYVGVPACRDPWLSAVNSTEENK